MKHSKNSINKIAKKKIYFSLIFIVTVFLFSGCNSEVKNIQPTANIQKTTQVQGVVTEKIVNNDNNVKVKNQKNLKLKEKKSYKTKEKAVPVIKSKTCGGDYYRNVSGNCIHRPSSSPSGASAKCRDGSYSYSQHRRGTCSGHGGVSQWL